MAAGEPVLAAIPKRATQHGLFVPAWERPVLCYFPPKDRAIYTALAATRPRKPSLLTEERSKLSTYIRDINNAVHPPDYIRPPAREPAPQLDEGPQTTTTATAAQDSQAGLPRIRASTAPPGGQRKSSEGVGRARESVLIYPTGGERPASLQGVATRAMLQHRQAVEVEKATKKWMSESHRVTKAVFDQGRHVPWPRYKLPTYQPAPLPTCLARTVPQSQYTMEFGNYGSNPRDRLSYYATLLPKRRDEVTIGTTKATLHIPGYSGFLSSSAKRLRDPPTPVPRSLLRNRDNLVENYSHFLPKYTGYQPTAAQNDRGPPQPTAATTSGYAAQEPYRVMLKIKDAQTN
ncbi:unnamed protein product [Vitrella brassicaformis CCMP3155]|uniref:Uncharacterized protein n=1 Tax=Vitrella brassicaformis (strain CCMP3155) TaxID=1169540 RepID=A0A0G4G8D6_VITBC|nr:unnamed protein product [Vitrella brassicaformis CCMP3155]|eukprot:CEM25147.1 unnamed protein product [Vitrella brassicaformis CCMP3155]